jgi:ribosomal protein L18
LRAPGAGVEAVVFDRGAYRYHGVKALAVQPAPAAVF